MAIRTVRGPVVKERTGMSRSTGFVRMGLGKSPRSVRIGAGWLDDGVAFIKTCPRAGSERRKGAGS